MAMGQDGRLRKTGQGDMARDLKDRLASLYRVGQMISSSLVLDEVLTLVIDSLIEITGAERGAILLLDERSDLVVRAARDLDRRAIAADLFGTSRNIVREVALSGVPRLISDATAEFSGQQYRSVLAHHLRSILCAPLKTRGAVRGVLYVDHRLATGAFTDEDLELLDAFAGQAAVAIENARMVEELAQQEGQRRELEIARSIQASLMPTRMPPTPSFDVAGACVPAHHVGGDFFDAITAPTGELVVVLGDVSGKGVPAALLMGMVRALLRSEIGRSAALEEAVLNCNRILYDDFTTTGMFATLVLGRLDPRTKQFSYINCGHCEPILWRRGAGRHELLSGDGLPLGILDEFETHAESVTLDSGDVLVAYSDGYSEAKSRSGERFGVARLAEAVREHAEASARAILDRIGKDVDRFVQPEPQSDDQTIVVIRADG
jgi:sigma-B regulation protein RsbU (phosphoserine phosphatase)